MSDTWSEVLEKLSRIDEVSLLELLEINSEQIVDRFQDVIEERYDELYYRLEDEQEED